MPFRIIGEHADGVQDEERQLPASAAVLALKWLEKGARRVAIESDGRRYDLESFRRRFLGRKVR